jgi:hypothetical protein
MIETKAESQTYLANPYNSLGSLPYHTDEYVISAFNFPSSISSFSFRFVCPVTCQMTTSKVSFNGQKPLSLVLSGLDWIVRPLATIHHFSLSHASDRR